MEDLDEIKIKQFKLSCCQSYLTPKGRCFSCPEHLELDLEENEPDLD